jgi:hypothetical protein
LAAVARPDLAADARPDLAAVARPDLVAVPPLDFAAAREVVRPAVVLLAALRVEARLAGAFFAVVFLAGAGLAAPLSVLLLSPRVGCGIEFSLWSEVACSADPTAMWEFRHRRCDPTHAGKYLEICTRNPNSPVPWRCTFALPGARTTRPPG